MRSIGEGHISSIGFCSAVVGPVAQWSFEPRLLPVSVADTTAARWRKAHLHAVLADQGHLDELAEAVLHALPAEFEGIDLERALAEARCDLLTRAGRCFPGRCTASTSRPAVVPYGIDDWRIGVAYAPLADISGASWARR